MYAQSTCNNFRSRSNYIKYFFNKKIFISFPILSIDIYIIRCFQFLEKKNIWLTGLDPSTWNFYLSFGLFRISAILQGVYKRSLRNQVIKGIVHLVKNRFKNAIFGMGPSSCSNTKMAMHDMHLKAVFFQFWVLYKTEKENIIRIKHS